MLRGAPTSSDTERLKETENRTATEACQGLGLPRSTTCRWQKRLEGYGSGGLEARSRRPKRVRKPTRSPQLVEGVLRWREGYPCWDKNKLVVLLRGEART